MSDQPRGFASDTEEHNHVAKMLAYREMLRGLIASHDKATESVLPDLRRTRLLAAVQFFICAVALWLVFMDGLSKWMTFVWGGNFGVSVFSLCTHWWPLERRAFSHWRLRVEMESTLVMINAEIEAKETGLCK